MIAKKRKSPKGKQHPVHAETLFSLAKELKKLSLAFGPNDLAEIFQKEGLRVQKIKR